MQFHPVAEIFPSMDDAALAALADDIGKHGLREPIWLHKDGRVIDGRNRSLACDKIGITPMTKTYQGEESGLVAFVVSLNLHRRHLNESQRGLIAARLATMKRGHVLTQRAGNTEESHGDEISPPCLSGSEAAALLNVDRSTVVYAKAVLRDATADEIKEVEQGKASVSTIAKDIRRKLPKELRKKKREQPQQTKGKNPERIQNMQIRAAQWRQLKDALLNLSALADPHEVAEIARTFDKNGIVNAKMEVALHWLEGFSNVWSKRGEAAA